MNAFVSSTLLNSRSPAEVIEYPNHSAQFVISSQLSCYYDQPESAVWSSWSPQGIPSFNLELLHDLERASQVIEGYFADHEEDRPLRYFVLRSGVPGAFNLGGDLGYFERLIAAQDRARLTEYARAAISVQYRNYCAHNLTGVTTIALLEGDALGGGLESALSCDVVIAEKHVKAGFPEVLFNMFPGMGGMSFLARRANRRVAEEMVRTGRQYSAVELLEMGVIDQVVESGEGRAAVTSLFRQRQYQQTAHLSISLADRLIRPLGLQELHDVVKIWVDCALHLSPRSIQWMQRMYQRQLSIFGSPLAIAADMGAVASTETTMVAAAA
jgi:DSF synthase